MSLTCSGVSGCSGGAPCPIGQTGYWMCLGGNCVSYCTRAGNNTSDDPPGPGDAPLSPPAPGQPCDPNLWTNFSECSGSPASKNRVNQCGGVQSIYCTGTINSRAVIVSPADATCAGAQASVMGLPGTVHQFTGGSASQPAPQTQTGDSYVTFSPLAGGVYTVFPQASPDYTLTAACWRKATNTPSSGTGLTTWLSVPYDADTLTWDLAYAPVGPWSQTEGGNVTAGGAIASKVPAATSPRFFNKDGSGGSPGIVSYGSTGLSPYDFDPDYLGTGETLVSSTNWLVNQPVAARDWYTYFFAKLGGPGTPDSFLDLTAVSKPASRTKPYYVVGDVTTSGDWAVSDGETITFLINGNLTIDGKITMTGTGFIAFIVKGDITISSNVGGLYTSSTPVIEGLYITSPTGTFKTGASSVAGKERLVLQGTFVAGNFLLQRDMESVGANATTASELFLYDPGLWLRAPRDFLNVPIVWQEVAP